MNTRSGKLFICDLDGVLVQSDGTIRKGDLEKIKEYQEDGGLFVICTGRMDQDIEYVEKQLGFKGSFRISQNGAVIKKKDGTILFHKTIKKVDTSLLNNILAQSAVRTEVNDINNRYFPSPRNPEEVAEFIDTSIVKEDLFEYVQKDLEPTIYLNFGDLEQFDIIREQVKQKVGEKVAIAQTSATSLEIFSNEASKGNAAKFIAEQLKISKDQIIVAGDAESDVTMFPHAGKTFAVGKSDKQTIKAAQYHVMNVEEIFTYYV